MEAIRIRSQDHYVFQVEEYYRKSDADAEIARLEVEVERLKRGLRLIGKIADSEEIGPELMDELEQLRSELKAISGGR